jgi:hypothetical protein
MIRSTRSNIDQPLAFAAQRIGSRSNMALDSHLLEFRHCQPTLRVWTSLRCAVVWFDRRICVLDWKSSVFAKMSVSMCSQQGKRIFFGHARAQYPQPSVPSSFFYTFSSTMQPRQRRTYIISKHSSPTATSMKGFLVYVTHICLFNFASPSPIR